MQRSVVFLLLLSACSSVERVVDRLEPVKEEKSVLTRGWAHVESEAEFGEMNAGQGQFTLGSPVIVDEKVIFGSDRFGITAVNKHTGQKVWQKTILDGLTGQILAHKGRLYVGGNDGQFRCLEAASGSEVWSQDLGLSVHGLPAMLPDRLIVTTMDDAVHALDPQTGKILWSYRRSVSSRTKILGGGNPVLWNGKVWVGFSDGSLLALDPQDGSVASEQSWKDNAKFSDVDARPVIWKDGLLVVTFDGKLRYLNGGGGSVVWEFPAGGARSPLVGAKNRIFLPSSDGAIYAIQGGTGKEEWRHILRRGVPTGVVMASVKGKDVLVVATSDEKIFAIDPDSGAALGSVAIGKGSGSSSALTADPETGAVFMVSHFSRLYQLKVAL